MKKTSIRRLEIGLLVIWALDQGLDQFQLYSALNHTIFEKNCPLNFVKISQVLTDMNALKSNWKSKWMEITISDMLGIKSARLMEIIICSIWELGIVVDRTHMFLVLNCSFMQFTTYHIRLISIKRKGSEVWKKIKHFLWI